MIILTKAQLLELRRLEEEAMAEMTKASPNYKSGLAGTALSAGGLKRCGPFSILCLRGFNRLRESCRRNSASAFPPTLWPL